MQTISSFKIRVAAEKIWAGEVIAYPTEAVYGLGCDPLNQQAAMDLLTIKKRSIEKGLILIASSIAQVEPYLQLNDAILATIQATWPGPVTWVIPCKSWVPYWLTGKHSSLAVRVTDHPIARLLCEKSNTPLISTSANTHAISPATHSWNVAKKLNNNQVFILPGQVGELNKPTPIIDVLSKTQMR